MYPQIVPLPTTNTTHTIKVKQTAEVVFPTTYFVDACMECSFSELLNNVFRECNDRVIDTNNLIISAS